MGIGLSEINGAPLGAEMVARVNPTVGRRMIDSIQEALKASSLSTTILGSRNKEIVELSEEPGVRLALTLMAGAPIKKRGRVEAIKSGVSVMSDEEAYYWYAKCMGQDSDRSRRSLRTLLAND